MNELDFIGKLSDGRSDLLKKVAADFEKKAFKTPVPWTVKHPHMTAAMMSGAVSGGLGALNATPGERLDAALSNGTQGAVMGAFISRAAHKMRKTAGASDKLKAVFELAKSTVKNHKPEIAGAMISGAAMALLDLKMSKKDATGKSDHQRWAEGLQNSSKQRMKEMQATGKEPGFTDKVTHSGADFYKAVADAHTQHRGQSAAVAGMAALPMGFQAGRFARNLLK